MQETQRLPTSINIKESTCRNVIFKLQKTKNRGIILKEFRGKKQKENNKNKTSFL